MHLVLSSVLALFWSVAIYANDPPPPESVGGSVPPPPGLVVPIDNNIPLLAAAGIVLGVFFMRKEK